MNNLLNQKPFLGVIAGVFSWLMYIIKTLLTDDTLLKYAAGAGIWLGLIVAILTIWVKVIDLRKKIFLPVALLAIGLASCKSRQVATEKKQVTDQSITTEIKHAAANIIDTGKITIHTSTKTSSKDSFKIEITPDSGAVQIIAGKFIGHAKHVTITGTDSQAKLIDQLFTNDKAEIKSDYLLDSTVDKKNIKAVDNTKNTSAKTNYTPLVFIGLGLIALGIACVYLYRKFFKVSII